VVDVQSKKIVKTETTAQAIVAPGFRIREMAPLLFKPEIALLDALGADELAGSLGADALGLVNSVGDGSMTGSGTVGDVEDDGTDKDGVGTCGDGASTAGEGGGR